MSQNLKSALNKSSRENAIQSELDKIIGGDAIDNKITGSNELEKREKELYMRELKFKAKQLLSQNSLPVELAEILKLDNEQTIEQYVGMLVKLAEKNENDAKFKVLDEKKLPDSKSEEKHMGELRKAFGLI